MKFSKILLTATVSTFLIAAPAFAAPTATSNPPQQKSDTLSKEKSKELRHQDPIKALEAKKEKVKALLKEGKITKEEANESTVRIDKRINEIKEFNKLTLEQKKDKLTSSFKASLEKRVSEGILTTAEADKALKEFTEKLEKWDGNGYPRFHGKRFKHGRHPCTDCKDK